MHDNKALQGFGIVRDLIRKPAPLPDHVRDMLFGITHQGGRDLSADARVSPARIARPEHIPLAIFYMIASGAVFNCANAASKWLIATYPIGEVLFARTLVALLTMAAFILPTMGFAVYRTLRLRAHMMRATSQVGSQ